MVGMCGNNKSTEQHAQNPNNIPIRKRLEEYNVYLGLNGFCVKRENSKWKKNSKAK